ncbi:MAG TPA: hypothetical protein VNQ76_18975 [Planctomicrobium sp.]|nr:hypothetical protein [Planctomicrobium sp.]
MHSYEKWIAWLVVPALLSVSNDVFANDKDATRPTAPQAQSKTDDQHQSGPLKISGVYPHLTTYGIYSQNGAHTLPGHDECGIGAVVPWADQLWMINYAPHRPRGSEHKLYSVDNHLKLTIHPESVGGTPAARMIHRESNQLLIGPYLISAEGQVRVIPPSVMPIRVTAIARHLNNPETLVYYIDMEGAIWEANVHSLEARKLFDKPVPGWHGKGGYTGQGRLIVSNNGEHAVSKVTEFLAGTVAQNDEDAGVLAEWDGQTWKIIERRQFTDITGPDGIYGGDSSSSPVWAIGWDRRSLRLKLLEEGAWTTYLLPKAALCNDAKHGWYTEWPRIREIGNGRLLMDMHGMFFDFPMTFSSKNSKGIAPLGSHLRYVPDFCNWNGQLVLATDETSIQGNSLAGQPQSNLWFGTIDDLKNWGPSNGYGGPWVKDAVKANVASDPFLIAGFDRRVLHLAVKDNENKPVQFTIQVDQNGDQNWTDLLQVDVPENGSVSHILPADLSAIWLRVKTNRDCVATAFLHQTAATYADGNSTFSRQLFGSLADVDEKDGITGLLYANKMDRNLSFLTSGNQLFQFLKEEFRFVPAQENHKLKETIAIRPHCSIDDASVIIESDGKRLRLPKGNEAFSELHNKNLVRDCREVESERVLANFHGTFYEVPILLNGRPPAFHLLRPVSSHQKQITDYCTWNGLLVLTGAKKEAVGNGQVFADSQKNAALWFGGIDDLWHLGKPVGVGGPWKKTAVKANDPSDPYLMTGYDKKTLTLESDVETEVKVEFDIDHLSGWQSGMTFQLTPDKPVIHRFEEGFSAHWVRFVSSHDANISATFVYE